VWSELVKSVGVMQVVHHQRGSCYSGFRWCHEQQDSFINSDRLTGTLCYKREDFILTLLYAARKLIERIWKLIWLKPSDLLLNWWFFGLNYVIFTWNVEMVSGKCCLIRTKNSLYVTFWVRIICNKNKSTHPSLISCFFFFKCN